MLCGARRSRVVLEVEVAGFGMESHASSVAQARRNLLELRDARHAAGVGDSHAVDRIRVDEIRAGQPSQETAGDDGATGLEVRLGAQIEVELDGRGRGIQLAHRQGVVGVDPERVVKAGDREAEVHRAQPRVGDVGRGAHAQYVDALASPFLGGDEDELPRDAQRGRDPGQTRGQLLRRTVRDAVPVRVHQAQDPSVAEPPEPVRGGREHDQGTVGELLNATWEGKARGEDRHLEGRRVHPRAANREGLGARLQGQERQGGGVKSQSDTPRSSPRTDPSHRHASM